MPDSELGNLPSALAAEIVRSLTAMGKTITLAESCTAGLVAGFIAQVPGASKVFWGSFVTYTADAKIKMLAVPEELIKKHGEVSRPTALAMAEGALEKSGVSLALSVTGLAGPGAAAEPYDTMAAGSSPPGDGSDIPVGTVWIGIADRDGNSLRSGAKMFHFRGSRNEVREAAAIAVLKEILQWVNSGEGPQNDIDNRKFMS
jgi:PncC family amidohydrolase